MAAKKTVVFRTFFIILCCICLMMEMFIYTNSLNQKLNSQIETILKEISAQSVMLVEKEIESKFDILNEISKRISYMGNLDDAQKDDLIKSTKIKYGFRNIGILYKDYSYYMANGNVVSIRDRMNAAKDHNDRNEDSQIIAKGAFDKVFNGENLLTDPIIDASTGETIIMYGVPIYDLDTEEINSVLVSVYSSETLRNMIEISSFNGQGYSYIVKNDGKMILNSANIESFQENESIYESMMQAYQGNKEAVQKMKELLYNNDSGYILFNNVVDKYMACSPIGINDWYMLNIIPVSVMEHTSRHIMNITYILCLSISTVFILFVIYIIVTVRKKNKQLRDILYKDSLTGGFSFLKFTAEAQKLIDNLQGKAAIVVMDIDRFRLINELLGYSVGDKALRKIHSFLKSQMGDGEVFARNEGDKFIIFMKYNEEKELAKRLTDIAKTMENEQNIQGYVLKALFGIYVINEDNRNINIKKMYNYALMALYNIKGKSNLCYAFFNDKLKEKLKNDKLMEDMILSAYENEEFIAYYQPKYDSETRRMIGAEALIRWKKPDGTYIPPFRFIPIAESSGLIVKLDKYIFEIICRQQKKWLDQGLKIVPISVNLSREHLYNPLFAYEYKSIIDEVGIPIEYVELEITESAMFDDYNQFLDIVNTLHDLGFKILMDDFGTGYSSLMMLKSIPIDVLKLDKSFIDDYNDVKDEKIITHIIRLAKSIDISVTAEGVETEEQYLFLKSLGCNHIQGFYFAKPMDMEDFENELRKLG